MASKNLEVEVGEKSLQLVEALGNFVKKVYVAVGDGWSPGQDLPAIALAAFQELVPVIGHLPEARQELLDLPDSQAILAALVVNELRDIV